MPVRIRLLLLLLFLLALPTIVPVATPASANACHGWATCPDPKSCGSWSTYYDCDAPFCGWDSFCEVKTGSDAAVVQPRERFRACTLQDGSQCLEYEVYTFRRTCGC